MKTLLSCTLGLSLAITASAATTFISDVDNVWGTAANWDNGLPGVTDNDGVIPAGKDVLVVANDNGTRNFSLLIEAGGSLQVSPGITLSSSNTGRDTTVSGTMTVQGTFIQLGGASDVFVNGGLLDIASGGTLDARKSTDVYNGGRLNLAATLGANWVPQNRLRVGNNGSVGTVHFDVHSGTHATIAGNTLNLDIGTASVLDIDAAGTGAGTYILISGISNWRDALGAVLVEPRPFATEQITNLDPSLEFEIVYDNTAASGARTVSLVLSEIVLGPPNIVTDPADAVDVLLGDTASFSAEGEGTKPLYYQWLDGVTPIPGATNMTLVVTEAGAASIGPFFASVSNSLGTITSQGASITSFRGPAALPVSQLVLQGNPVQLQPGQAEIAGMSYQWRKDAIDQVGATAYAFGVSSAEASDTGLYTVLTTLGGHTVTSEAATVSVPLLPFDTYENTVAADAPLAWWRLGEAPGATVAVDSAGSAFGPFDGLYQTGVVQGAEGALLGNTDTAGYFPGTPSSKVTQTNAVLWVPSAAWSIELWARAGEGSINGNWRVPIAYKYKVNDNLIDGWQFSVNAAGQWEFKFGEGPNIGGGNAWNALLGPQAVEEEWIHLLASFDGTDGHLYVNGLLTDTLTNVVYAAPTLLGLPLWIGANDNQQALNDPPGDGSGFWIGDIDEVAIYDYALDFGQVENHFATGMDPSVPPTITTHPLDLAVWADNVDALFNVVGGASGSTLHYQWRLGGGALANATNATLTVMKAGVADAGNYDVVVSNLGGSVTSQVAVLTILEDAADTVLSVNLQGYADEVDDIAAFGGVAGVVRTNAWNEVGRFQRVNDVPLGGLLDSTGIETGVTLTWACQNTRAGRLDELGGIVDADQALIQANIESRDAFTDTGGNAIPVTLTIANIPTAYANLGYDLYVYLGGPGGALTSRYDNVAGSFMGMISDGATTYYYHQKDQRAWDGTFARAMVTDLNNPAPPDANYAVFTGLSASEVTLTADCHPLLIEGPAAIAGFQIVPGGSVLPPEMGVALPRDGTLVISWSAGVLQSSTNLPAGAWMDVPGAVSPHTVDGSSGLSIENFRVLE